MPDPAMREAAREWRIEFPCQVIHCSYPAGTTCLDCRDYAIKNEAPHRYGEELSQRYINWDRTLFCDNCWSCRRAESRERSAYRQGLEDAANAMCRECESRMLLLTNKEGEVWHARFIGDETQLRCFAEPVRRKLIEEAQ